MRPSDRKGCPRVAARRRNRKSFAARMLRSVAWVPQVMRSVAGSGPAEEMDFSVSAGGTDDDSTE